MSCLIRNTLKYTVYTVVYYSLIRSRYLCEVIYKINAHHLLIIPMYLCKHLSWYSYCTTNILIFSPPHSLILQIYVGVTDHLWGKHCQRDFKDSKLQEYESWKEMYIRLSEERERKLKRLTKTIVSAQSQKPKGDCSTLNATRVIPTGDNSEIKQPYGRCKTFY